MLRWNKLGLIWIVWALTAGSACAAENWPGWRGGTGMGQSDEQNLPLTWGGTDQENVLWKAPLFPSEQVKRDQNQSSPIVWGDRVFVTASYWPEGAATKNYPQHHVMCFGTARGDKLWDVTVEPGPWKLSDLRGGYTAPTPACDGTHVYALFGSSVLAAVDFTGKIVWRKQITPFFFDVCIGTSPVVVQDTVIVCCDQQRERKSSKLLAYSGKTGEIVWQKERAVDWAHSTPTLAKIAGRTQLLAATANGPQGLDPASGAILWEYPLKERVGDTVSPVVMGSMVYVDSGRGSTGIAVDATGTGDVSKTGLRWRIPGVPEGFSSPVVAGDYLYRLNSPGVVSCWKWADGKAVYKERLQGIDPATSPIATSDGRVYCASAGKSYVLKAGPTFAILAQNDLGDPSRAAPAVAAGRIYLKGSKYLFCIGKK